MDKAKYWLGVGYPENMIPDWEDRIYDLFQLPFAYCKHFLDKDSKSEHRKDHVHFIIVFPNTTTYNHALTLFNTLSLPGKKAFNKCEQAFNIRHSYDYLVHNTEGAKKAGKYLYSYKDIVQGNNFDIGLYEQVSTADKENMRKELARFIIDKQIENFTDLYIYADLNLDDNYTSVITANSGFFERLCKGFYLKRIIREKSIQNFNNA